MFCFPLSSSFLSFVLCSLVFGRPLLSPPVLLPRFVSRSLDLKHPQAAELGMYTHMFASRLARTTAFLYQVLQLGGFRAPLKA